MKKVVISIIFLVLIIFISTLTLADTSQLSATANISSSELKSEQEVVVKIGFDNYGRIRKGLNSYKATLEYDEEIFEEVLESDFTCQNDWESLKYNKATKEFVAIKKVGSKEAEEIVEIKLKVKPNVKATKTNINIKEIVTSEGYEDISIENVNIPVDIIDEQQEKPEEPKIEKVTSQKYKIGEEYIERIMPQTTVAQFKGNVTLENVTTNPQMIFTDKDGNTLQDNSLITTGTKVKIGNTLNYTLVVIGDIDSDARLSINDMAALKLHRIELETLDGIKLRAADVDNDGEVTINDLAQMRLILIDLLELQ